MSTEDALDKLKVPDDTPGPRLGGEPDVSAVTTEAEYMVLLRQLRQRSGISYKELAKRWKEKFREDARERSTVYDLFKRDRLPRKPEQLRQVLTLLVEAYDGDPCEVQRYFELGERLLQSRVTSRTGTPSQCSDVPGSLTGRGPDAAAVTTEAECMLRRQQGPAIDLDATVLGEPQQRAQPQPAGGKARCLVRALLCLLLLGSGGVTLLLALSPWWVLLGIALMLIGACLLVSMPSRLP